MDPGARYQQTSELCADLNRLDDDGVALPEPKRFTWRIVAAAVVVVSALAGGVIWLTRPVPPPKAHDPVSVLVADFDNRTGEAVFDDTLEPMFNVALEEAGFINAFSRGTARRLAGKLPTPTERLDKAAARLVAVSQDVGAVITGELSGQPEALHHLGCCRGCRHRERARAGGGHRRQQRRSVACGAAGGRAHPQGPGRHHAGISAAGPHDGRRSLRRRWKPCTSMEGAWNCSSPASRTEALSAFTKAAELDPGFARAYSGMAAQAFSLGRRQDFEKYIGLALAHVDRMTEREAYRVRSLYYVRTGNLQKCVSEGAEMLQRYPADNVVTSNLAGCYLGLRNFPKAMEAARHAVDLAPNGVLQLVNLAFASIYAGDFPGAEKAAQAAIQHQSLRRARFSRSGRGPTGPGKAGGSRGNLRQAGTPQRRWRILCRVGAWRPGALRGPFP